MAKGVSFPRDHYVPQFYLRNFERRGKFYLYDKAFKRGWGSNAFKTAKEENFYGFVDTSGEMNRDLETHLSKDEGRYAEAIRNVLEATTMSGSDLTMLLEFISLQYVRTPAMVDEMAASCQVAGEMIIEKVLNNPTFMGDYLSKHPQTKPDELRAGLGKVRFKGNRDYAMVQSLAHAKEVLTHLSRKAAALGGGLVHAPQGQDFVTSDSPVNVFLRLGSNLAKFGGIAHPGSEIWVPLSPEFGIFIGPRPDNLETEECATAFCLELNRRVMWDAVRFVVATFDGKTAVEDFAPKSPFGAQKLDKESLRQHLLASGAI